MADSTQRDATRDPGGASDPRRAGVGGAGVGVDQLAPAAGGQGDLTGGNEATGPGADAGVTSGSRATGTAANLGETEAIGPDRGGDRGSR